MSPRHASGDDGSIRGRRQVVAGMAAVLAAGFRVRATRGGEPAGLPISNRLSPRNSRRPRRPGTRFIILHTTEGEENGSLRKVQARGEAHYFVSRSGHIYRIIDRRRIATHAGRSMWDGVRVVDNYSIGIEVVGYHNRDIAPAQYESLRGLLAELKSIYGIRDEAVLTHSMVAYGRPNRFHRNYHRGRKRCGMLFARPDVRKKLGLESRPLSDPDVKAGRLKVADTELFAYLFRPRRETEDRSVTAVAYTDESNVVTRDRTPWQIARDQYDHPETIYTFPDRSQLRGDQIEDWGSLPAGTVVSVGSEEGDESFEGFIEARSERETAESLAGESWAGRTTIYFFPDGLVRTGYELNRRRSTRSLLKRLPKGTRILVGYIYGGYVRAQRPAVAIAGHKWNYPSTYYRLPDGTVVSGDEIDPAAIPVGTLLFFQN